MAKFIPVPGLDEMVAQMIAPEVGKIAKKVELTAKRLAPPTKKWVSMGDHLVRNTHREANGQEIPENLRFRVTGQPWDIKHGYSIGIDWMLHPKDTSTGLPSDVVQNVHCRCTTGLDPLGIADKISTGPTRVMGTEVHVTVSCTAVQIVECEFGDDYPTIRGGVHADGTHFMGRAAAQVAAG